MLGEIIVSALTVGVYFAIGKYTYKVLTGVILGSAVIILNFLFLIDNFLILGAI